MNLLGFCDAEAASVSVEASAADAIQTMLNRRVGAVGILDSAGRVAGIFTERDVLRKLALSRQDPKEIRVRDVMTTPVEMATLATTPGEAMSTMVDRHFRHLPVVDSNGKLLGMLSIRNLLQLRVDELTQQLDSLEQFVTNDGPGG
jgi:CBS domain-containing protein